ncbi:hypothetical protein Poly51_15340 [Rubripirellula tenax]|uniref:Uncharacterized protein n=1 Tax=Rubripirellula tenax TaxID=2528015 RepID=A0A5C6FEY4_9BACT|nr:hypothetical protein [Rubripirellula tenax]TWU58754.1 hypothetical protein Poly51_15340 [Rubripirellula tenax]
MKPASTLPRYLIGWDHSQPMGPVRDVVAATHRLHEISVFSDEGLATLIDGHPRSAIEITTMGDNPAYPNERRFGDLGPHDGHSLLEMVRRSRLSLVLKDIQNQHPLLREVMVRLVDELAEVCPRGRTSHIHGDIVIESPGAMEYLNCDAVPTTRWQVRGSRQVWTYPVSDSAVTSQAIDSRVKGCPSHPSSLYYEPAIEGESETFDVPVGRCVQLPILAPYRTTVGESMSVSLRTRHIDQSSRKQLEGFLGRMALGNRIGLKTTRPSDHHRILNRITATMHQVAGRVLCRRWLNPTALMDQTSIVESTFQIDPSALRCVRLLSPSETVHAVSNERRSPAIAPNLFPTFLTSPFAVNET